VRVEKKIKTKTVKTKTTIIHKVRKSNKIKPKKVKNGKTRILADTSSEDEFKG
jgi:hypothetical protein